MSRDWQLLFCLCVPLSRVLSRACYPNCSYLNTFSATLENPEFCRRVSIEDFRKIDRCCCVMVSEQSMEEFLKMLATWNGHGTSASSKRTKYLKLATGREKVLKVFWRNQYLRKLISAF